MAKQERHGRYTAFKSQAALFFQKNGFYVVLFLCLAVIGVCTALALVPGEDSTPDEALLPTPSAAPVRQSGDERLSALLSPTPDVTPAPTPEVTPTPKPRPASTPAQKAPAPVDGAIQFGYAADTLLYSRTLDQWTTHPGVDIASKEGTAVKAVFAGQVERVYEDDALGVTVVVSHSGGRKSVYANLAPNPPVKEKQKLNAGDVVGAVGSTAVSECADRSHLHFGFFIDDKPVDPAEHVLFAKMS